MVAPDTCTRSDYLPRSCLGPTVILSYGTSSPQEWSRYMPEAVLSIDSTMLGAALTSLGVEVVYNS